MNNYRPEEPDGFAFDQAAELLREYEANGVNVHELLNAANAIEDDDTRDNLVNAQLLATLRHTDVTYTLWLRLLRTVNHTADLREALWRVMFGPDDERGPADDGNFCVALVAIQNELDAACERLADPGVRHTLSLPPTRTTAILCSVTLARLIDYPPVVTLVTDTPAHTRDHHKGLWDKLAIESLAPWAVAMIAQWQAATRELVRANDELLRHLNRRAEGGYPASDTEVSLLTELLNTEVTRGGDGSVTVEAGSCPWRDDRGRIIHPLGIEQLEA